MPLYEYVCQACRVSFEAYVRSWDEAPCCPSCGGGALDKQLSSFAMVGAGSSAPHAAGGCGCGRGGCACH
jgi:putative FmdB family regulatory protein